MREDLHKRIIRCNCCGRRIDEGRDYIKKDYLLIKKQWGYFSKKDGCIQKSVICEECYDEWISSFAIPPEQEDATELL